jgi:hypothetical protein
MHWTLAVTRRSVGVENVGQHYSASHTGVQRLGELRIRATPARGTWLVDKELLGALGLVRVARRPTGTTTFFSLFGFVSQSTRNALWLLELPLIALVSVWLPLLLVVVFMGGGGGGGGGEQGGDNSCCCCCCC